MIVKIEDKSIEKILQIVLKEELEFLARQLVRRPEVRKVLWAEVSDQLPEIANGLKLAKTTVNRLRTDLLEGKAGLPPAWGGGGSGTETSGGEEKKDGGGSGTETGGGEEKKDGGGSGTETKTKRSR